MTFIFISSKLPPASGLGQQITSNPSEKLLDQIPAEVYERVQATTVTSDLDTALWQAMQKEFNYNKKMSFNWTLLSDEESLSPEEIEEAEMAQEDYYNALMHDEPMHS